MMFARKSALIIFTNISAAILGYIGLKFIALYMQPWEYGIIGFAYGYVALFSFFGQLGFDEAHIKRVSEGKNLGICNGTNITIRTLLTGFMGSLVILSILFWKLVVGRGFESDLHEQAVYILLAYFVLASLTNSLVSTFNARKEIAKSQISLFFYHLLRIIALLVVVYNRFGVLALAYTYFFGEIFHFMLAFYFFRRYPIGKPSYDYFIDYAKFAIPIAITSASYIVMTNIDKVFIQLFWSATEVGEYFAIKNLSQYIILFGNAIGLLLFPTISEYHSNKNSKKIRSLILETERYLSMLVFPIVIVMIVLAQPIIHILLSDKYMSALILLQLLPIFALIEVMSYPYMIKLKGMNMPHLARNRLLIMLIFNILLNLILIPKDIKSIGLELAGLGPTGAVIATICSTSIGFIYIRYVSWKYTNIVGTRKVFYHAITALLMGTILYLLNTYFSITRWYHLLCISIFGLCLYVVILYIIKEFTKKDFQLFMDTFNIKKMIMYLKEEIKKK